MDKRTCFLNIVAIALCSLLMTSCVVNDGAFENSEDPQRLAWFRSFVGRNMSRLGCVFENADFQIYAIADGMR